MKKNLTAFLMLVCGSYAVHAQDLRKQYQVTGYIKDIQTPNSYVYLQGSTGDSAKNRTDSVKITDDGHFTFSGKAEPSMVKVYTQRLGHPHYINPMNLFLDGGKINITATYDTTQFIWMRDVKITGSAAQDEFDRFNKEVEKLNTGVDYKKLQDDYKAAQEKKDTASLSAIMKIYREGSEKRAALTNAYIKAHPKSSVSLYFLTQMAMQISIKPDEKTVAEARELFFALDPSLQFSGIGKKTSDRMTFATKGLLMGKSAGDFSQPTVTGKLIKLSDYKGKYVLLDFWASWCGPCRAENPNVLQAYNKYKDKGFDILAVSLDDNAENWKKAIKEDKLPWTQVSDLKQSKNDAVQQFGVSGIPDNFLIDPKGVVIARGLRGEELFKKLEEVMGSK